VAKGSLPKITGRPLSGDDASGAAKPWPQISSNTRSRLPDGYTMEWLRPAEQMYAKEPLLFRFQLKRPDGTAPPDMALYMGMLGHAAFVKTDGTVFAHIHPTGTVSMGGIHAPTAAIRWSPVPGRMDMPGMDHQNTAPPALPNEVRFPYGFPSPGRYRIFVQMKHGQTIDNG
jgi:hypothetical protein